MSGSEIVSSGTPSDANHRSTAAGGGVGDGAAAFSGEKTIAVVVATLYWNRR